MTKINEHIKRNIKIDEKIHLHTERNIQIYDTTRISI